MQKYFKIALNVLLFGSGAALLIVSVMGIQMIETLGILTFLLVFQQKSQIFALWIRKMLY